MSTLTATDIPGYVAGTWTIDPTHSDVSFTVRHMMVSKVRGHFGTFSGQIVTADNPLESTVVAVVDATSFDTTNVDRDNHIRSADFLEVDKYRASSSAPLACDPAGPGSTPSTES